MAYINEYFESSDGTQKMIRVPSSHSGTDRTIYVAGQDSGYKLGNENDRVYTKHGREVSSSLKDFVRNYLGGKKFGGCIFAPLFFIAFSLYFI